MRGVGIQTVKPAAEWLLGVFICIKCEHKVHRRVHFVLVQKSCPTSSMERARINKRTHSRNCYVPLGFSD